ncbi:hypothetical protein PIB30_037941, partial [Stylosanthes scabra]|nr:hypothetical protein [Stylosanthes scabra]
THITLHHSVFHHSSSLPVRLPPLRLATTHNRHPLASSTRDRSLRDLPPPLGPPPLRRDTTLLPSFVTATDAANLYDSQQSDKCIGSSNTTKEW